MDNALELIQGWIRNSRWKVEIIKRSDREDNCEELLGISEHSTLGSIINHVGGISTVNGCIRHFGGNNRYGLSIREVNQIRDKIPTRFKGVLVVADDVYGGLFAINHSLPLASAGVMLYLPPDSYNWESMDVGHSAFVHWSLCGDVALFYKTCEKVPVSGEIPFDRCADYNPPLWAGDVKNGEFKYTLTESTRMHQIRAEILEQLS